MLEATRLMTIDEYVRRYEQEGAFEIYDGEIVPLMPPVTIHGWVIRLLFRLMDTFCTTHGLGEVFTEMPFILDEKPNWVKGSRVPDVLFFSAARWSDYLASMPDWSEKPFLLVPDLVVEVVSANDRYTDVQKKVDYYLKDGIRMIWVIDPARQSASVYQDHHFVALGENDTLSGGDVLPNFSVKVGDLFVLPMA